MYIMGLDFKSFGLYIICYSTDVLFGISQPPDDGLLDEIYIGIYESLDIHSLPLVQIWVPYPQSGSLKVLCRANAKSSSIYHEFGYVSKVCLPSVQLLQDGGETTQIDSFYQQSNLQNGENNVAAALLVPSCSSHKHDSLNCEGTVEVDLLLPHPIEEALLNRGTVNVDVAHDDHIEDTSEMMQLDSHFEQPNLEINSAGNARNNNEKIHSQKNKELQRIENDHGITREIREQHYGMILQDATKNLRVSRETLKRICRVYGITRWPHHKTRKVNFHVIQEVSFQGAEPFVGDQQCPALSQEKGTDYLGSPAAGVPRDSMMTLKVTYRDDIIKFQLSLSSTRVELEGEVEKRLKISLQRFSIKYKDEDDDWILITTDSDLSYGMHSLRLSGRTTMRLLVTPKADT